MFFSDCEVDFSGKIIYNKNTYNKEVLNTKLKRRISVKEEKIIVIDFRRTV